MDAYEKSDARIDVLAKFGVALVVLILVSLAVVGVIWRVFANNTVYTGDNAGSPLAPMRSLPPSPRLQVTPAADLKEFREQGAALLSSYAWIDKDKGVVRIPIDRAMDVIAERGVPGASK